MKKNILKYIVLAFGVFAATSCTDFLDNAPDGDITLEMVFNDRTRIENWLAGMYNSIPDPHMKMMRNYDAYADDFSPSAGWEAFSNWDCISKIKGNWNSESPWDGNFWGDLPVKIRESYVFMEQIKPLPDQGILQADVDNLKAESRFLIAYYYYLLVNTYGAIPLQTWLSGLDEPIESLMIGQNPYDDVIDWIDKELWDVAQILPYSYLNNQDFSNSHKFKYYYGRATSIMALAVRARMLLFAASPLVNGNDDPDYANFVNDKGEHIFNSTYNPQKWKRAVDACKDLIDAAEANGHKLYYEYNDDGTIDPFMSYSNMSFKQYHEGNKELLFVRSEGSWDDMQTHASPGGSNGNGGLGVTQSLVDAFFMSNGLPAITGYTADRKPIINQPSGYKEKGFSTTADKRKTKWEEGSADARSSQEINTVVPAGIFNMYVNREPRFYISVLYNEAYHRVSSRYVNFYKNGLDGINRPGSSGAWDAPQNGYLLRKRMHPDFSNRNNIKPYRPGILYRLGEAYLNYAEALNEWDPSQKDEILKYVNLIRERAGIPTYGDGADQIPAPTTPEGMRDIIHRERRVEFNCEFAIRFDDIRRWKQMDLLKGDFDGMNANATKKSDNESDPDAYYVRKVYITRAFSDKNYWLPVHQNQLDKNWNLRQLPKW